MDRTLVVMAAGFGSRYGGIKQMDGVGPSGETLLEYAVYDAIASGFNKVVFIVRPDIDADFKERVSSKFEDKIEVVHAHQTLQNIPKGFEINPERTKPLGTGHAVWCARKVVSEPFVVINADDFYGRSSFKKVFEYYENPENSKRGSYCMVAYKLKNTLSDHGYVNRGECFVGEDVLLSHVEERIGIQKHDDNFAIYPEDQKISLEAPVSMNFWGFTSDFFEIVENQLIDFLNKNARELTAELYVPAIVSSSIQDNLCSVKVLETDSKWYGMTYPDDRPVVVNAIKEMVEKGIYPENLWR